MFNGETITAAKNNSNVLLLHRAGNAKPSVANSLESRLVEETTGRKMYQAYSIVLWALGACIACALVPVCLTGSLCLSACILLYSIPPV